MPYMYSVAGVASVLCSCWISPIHGILKAEVLKPKDRSTRKSLCILRYLDGHSV